MSQAQIAGGSVTQHNELPPKGHRLREFELTGALGRASAAAGDNLPSVADVLNWLEFVNAQCPECEPPEWPV